MKMFNRIALATALLVPATAAPASAQSWKWDFGVNAGYARFTKSVSADSLGVAGTTGGTSGEEQYLRFENKVRFGGTLGYWFTQKMGIRANYKYSDNSLMEGASETKLIEPINLHSGSGDLLFRLGSVNETWMGSEFLPYLALGLGAKWANPTQDAQICQDPTDSPPKEWNCFSATLPGGTGRRFAISEDKTIMGLVGLGADWRFSPHVALSLEVNDRIFRPQIAFAQTTGTANTFTMPNGDHRISKWTHEYGADIGLKFLFGLATPPVVVMAPPPPPPPVVMAPPPPPPPVVAPREDAISVCVVDPTQPNGLRMQNAIYLPASGDTMVVMNGNRVRLSSTVGNVMVARNADWYVRGEPLTITIGKEKMQYSTEAGATMINSSDLSYLGTVNGYPVYARASEVADVNQALADLRKAQASRDLGNILDERKDLRGELDDVKLLYVPLQSTGCVFQTFRMIEMVKKGK